MVSRSSIQAACFVTFVAALAALWAQRERLARIRQAEMIHAEELVEQTTARRHQYKAAAAVVERLAAGELSLAAAVVELQSVFQSDVRAMARDFGKYFRGRGPTDHEVLAFYAINKIRSGAGGESSCRRAALFRLEDEYRVLFDRPFPAEW